MSDYNWCHGSKCHLHKTQDRIRGVKGSKVLRTKKIAITKWNENNVWSHFCSTGCWNDFMHTHWNEFINLHPRSECLETPIDVEEIKHPEEITQWGWTRKAYTEKRISYSENNQ